MVTVKIVIINKVCHKTEERNGSLVVLFGGISISIGDLMSNSKYSVRNFYIYI